MRIAIGGTLHESNTFVSELTPLSAFGIRTGAGIERAWRDTHNEFGGFLEGLETAGVTTYLTMTAGATPSGPVAADAFDALSDALIESLERAPRLDGLLLALHGAMVVEGHPDGDGEFLRRIRAAVGPELPIVVTLDFHANVSEAMAAAATALVVYRTNPHVDQRACGRRAAALLVRIIRERRQPSVNIWQPPMIWNILHQNTSRDPLRAILAEAIRTEVDPEILSADIAIGYPYADVHEVGPCAITVSEDAARARREAARLAQLLWEARDRLTIDLPDAAAAVARAIASPRTPVVLVEMGDNIGGGSPGDSTICLGELIEQGATGFIVTLWDPEAVAACVECGAGRMVTLVVGGKTDDRHGEPIEVTGRIRSLHDGRFTETQARHGGAREWNQGTTAVLELEDDGLLVLNSRRTPPFSLEQLRSLDLEPEQARILVVKAAIAFRAAYEPIAGEIIEVDTPGVTAVSPDRFPYTSARRPLWPLDSFPGA
jgi:microcystin degradation protein MlrC